MQSKIENKNIKNTGGNTLQEAARRRHSVRQYQPVSLSAPDEKFLRDKIDELNKESSLHMQLITNEPKAFGGTKGRIGKFEGVTNYIALVGSKSRKLEEYCGYFGEELVLEAQLRGLNSCWVAGTYSKIPEALEIGKGEKLTALIAIGYGKNQGNPHRSKDAADVIKGNDNIPGWFAAGVKSALLAPSAMNRQNFSFRLKNDMAAASSAPAPFAGLDLGIAKYHFELGADEWLEKKEKSRRN